MAQQPPELAVLPERNDAAEDAFVTAWLASDDLDLLEQVITDAMDARRPRLAARLVQLLPDHVEIEPGSPLERASRAASMLVVDSRNVELFNALDEAWREVRRKRMRRMMTRQRLVGTNKQYTVPRVGRRPRKR